MKINTYNAWMLAVIFLVTACGMNDGEKFIFEQAKVEKIVKIAPDDADSPQCSVSLNIHYATAENGPERASQLNDKIERKFLAMTGLDMQQAVDSFANKYTRDYVQYYAPLYREDRKDEQKRSWYEYHYVIETDVQDGQKGVVVYLATLDYYEGGAHGINQQFAMNFDQRTGHVYQLSDLFVPGYEQRLAHYLEKALCEKTGAKNKAGLQEMGYLFSMDMFAPENFIMRDETITFLYNPYEIAPYALGKTELTLSWSELEDIKK